MLMLILGQKSCILGPTIFKIPQPNWHYYRPNGTIRDVGAVSTNFWHKFDFTLWIIHLSYKIFQKLEESFPHQDLLTFLQPCFSGDTVTWLHSSRVCCIVQSLQNVSKSKGKKAYEVDIQFFCNFGDNLTTHICQIYYVQCTL